MASVTLEVNITFSNGLQHTINCTEDEYNTLLIECPRMVKADGYYDCFLNWDEVSFITVTDVTQGDEYGQSEATTAAQ
jgi:hypothetical protein